MVSIEGSAWQNGIFWYSSIKRVEFRWIDETTPTFFLTDSPFPLLFCLFCISFQSIFELELELSFTGIYPGWSVLHRTPDCLSLFDPLRSSSLCTFTRSFFSFIYVRQELEPALDAYSFNQPLFILVELLRIHREPNTNTNTNIKPQQLRQHHPPCPSYSSKSSN